MEKLIELADKYSGGSIKGTKIAGGSLGGEREETEMLQLGTLECAFISDMGVDSAIGGLGWAWLPFMLTDYDQVDEYYINGWINDELTKAYADNGLIRVACTENSFRECGNVKRPINSMADLNGLKIRVPESQLYLDVWQALGATPVALALPELALALSNGTAEAQDNATYHLVANATYDDIKYFSNINYMWMGCTMAANANTWNGLDPAVQEILKEQAKAAAKYSFDTIAADNETATKTLQDAGVEFDFEPDVQSFKDALGGDAYYDQYKDESWYDQELLDAILAEVR